MLRWSIFLSNFLPSRQLVRGGMSVSPRSSIATPSRVAPVMDDSPGSTASAGSESENGSVAPVAPRGKVLMKPLEVSMPPKVKKSFSSRRAMDEAVAAEQRPTSQRVGRCASTPPVPLLSELRNTSPLTYAWRRWLYRAEGRLESAGNRVAALLAAVVALLILGVGLFLGVAWLSGGELASLVRDAAGEAGDADDDAQGGVGGDGAGDEALSSDSVLLFATWLTWCFFIDPGSHTAMLDPLRYRWGRLVAAVISLTGVIFFSFVLGFVVELMQSFMIRVTEGRSAVVEEGHYLILGYSEKCVAVIGELATAMDSDGGGVVVVLADTPTKAEFDELVAAHLASLGLRGGRTRVVFRPGSPLVTSNLLRVSPETSRAVIVLSDTRQDADHADAMVLRVILSLKAILRPGDGVVPSSTGLPKGGGDKVLAEFGYGPGPLPGGGGGDRAGGYRGHVVAELRDNDNKPIIKVSGGELVELVVVHDIIGRMLAKSTVQPNIRRIYDDLLGFEVRVITDVHRLRSVPYPRHAPTPRCPASASAQLDATHPLLHVHFFPRPPPPALVSTGVGAGGGPVPTEVAALELYLGQVNLVARCCID